MDEVWAAMRHSGWWLVVWATYTIGGLWLAWTARNGLESVLAALLVAAGQWLMCFTVLGTINRDLALKYRLLVDQVQRLGNGRGA